MQIVQNSSSFKFRIFFIFFKFTIFLSLQKETHSNYYQSLLII